MRRYALLVGVEEYEEGSGISTLKYACRDAQVIAEKLRSDCGFETVRVLADRDGDGLPTDNVILRELRDAAVQLCEEDLFLFFFAGHGIEQEVNGTMRSYLLPRNTDLEFHRGLLETAVLHKVLDKIPCRQRLILLDSCRNDPEVGRGEADNRLGEHFSRDLALASTRSLIDDRVTVLMTSCQPGKRAYEWDNVKHGIFSHYLQEGLAGAAWENGSLEAVGLCRYVHQAMRTWSAKFGKEQLPDFKQLESPHPIILATKPGASPSRAASASVVSPQYVECPLCGGMNEVVNTFRCKGCGEKNLCRSHQDAKKYVCEQCVLKSARVEVVVPKIVTPTGPKVGDVITEPVTGMELVYVPGGLYQMGDTFGDGSSYEKPVHEVSIGQFWLGKYPVTEGQWQKVMGLNFFKKGSKSNNPVEPVSWDDIQEYIKRLNRQSGKKYRLPSESEWEYAARSGGKSEKWSGTSYESDLSEYAWYDRNSGGSTHPVGQKKPNGLGLYDMTGNVWEWCQDRWNDNYHSAPTDGQAWESEKSFSLASFNRIFEARVIRGGCYNWEARNVRVASRSSIGPGNRNDALGFRLLLPV